MPTPRSLLAAVAATLALAAGTLAPAQAEDVDATPIGFLTGDQTRLTAPVSVAVDAAGNRYVANLQTRSVVAFAPRATGNVAPTREIAGSSTGLVAPRAVAVDAAGRIYVADGAPWSIRVFAADADGDVAPVAVIAGANTMLGWPAALAFDTDGRLLVADRETDTIRVFAPETFGNVAPIRSIAGPSTLLDGVRGLAVDAANRIHVANLDGRSITTYAAGASGDAAPTQLVTPWALALDPLGNVYVTNVTSFVDPPEMRSVVVFDAAAAGDVAPVHRLTGPSTDLGDGYGLAVDSAHRISVSNYAGTGWLGTYAPLVAPPSGRPARVRGLEVHGKPRAAHRTIGWQVPDGPEVTGYRVTVRKGTRVLLTAEPTKTRLVVDRSDLARGKHVVRVVAVNDVGAGPAAVTRFVVR